MDNKYTKALEKATREKKEGEDGVMSELNKENEAEIYDLSKSDDEIQRQATIQKVVELENQDHHESLVQLMLDTYKQKVAADVRKEIEEKFRAEFERKQEVERIKNSYDALQSEREKIRIKDLEEKLKKALEERKTDASIIDTLKEEKTQLDVQLAKEINYRNVLAEEKQVIAASLDTNKKKQELLDQQIKELEKSNDMLEQKRTTLQNVLDQKAFELNNLREVITEEKETVAHKGGRKSEYKQRALELESKLEHYRNEIDRVQNNLEKKRIEYESQLDKTRAEKIFLMASVEQNNIEKQKVEIRIQALEKENDNQKTTIHDLQQSLNTIRLELDKSKELNGRGVERIADLEMQIKSYIDEVESNHKTLYEKDLQIDKAAHEVEFEKKSFTLHVERHEKEKHSFEEWVNDARARINEHENQIVHLKGNEEKLQNENAVLAEKLSTLIHEKETLQDAFTTVKRENETLAQDCLFLQQKYDEKKLEDKNNVISFEDEKKHLLSLLENIKGEKEKVERSFLVLEKEEKGHQWEIEFLKKYVKERTLEIEKQQNAFAKDRELLESIARESKRGQEQLERRTQELEIDLQNVRGERDTLMSADHDKLSEIQGLKNVLARERDAQKAVLREYENNKEKLKSHIAQLEITNKELVETTEELQSAIHDKEDAEKQLLESEKAKKEYSDTIALLQTSLEEKESIVATVSSQLDELKKEKQALEGTITELHGQDNRFAQEMEVLRQEGEEKKQTIEKMNEELTVLRDEKLKKEEHGNLFRDEIARIALDKLKIEERHNELVSRASVLEKEKNDLCDEKALLVETLAQKEKYVTETHNENSVLKETVDENNKRIHDTDKKTHEQSTLIHQYESVIAELEKEKKCLLHENDLHISENSSLKREISSVSQTAEDACSKIDRESLKRIKLEKENTTFHEKIEHIETINQNLSDKIRELTHELQRTQKDLQLSVAKSQEDEVKSKEDVASLREHNSQLTDQLKNVSARLKEIDILQSEKSLNLQEMHKMKKEFEIVQSELDAIKKRNAFLMEENTKERSTHEEFSKENELLHNEKRLLENNIKSYNHSLQDMQLLLDSEKERSKSLEREREHLKKCLDISQRAFSVNKKLADLKTDDEKSLS